MHSERESIGTIVSDPIRCQIPWDKGQQFFDLWNQVRGDRQWPQKAEINPVDMKSYIASIMLFEVIYDGQQTSKSSDFIVRLAGTAYRNFMPYDITGHSLGGLPDGDRIVACFNSFLRQKTSHLLTNQPLMWPDHEFKKFAGLLVPLGDDNQITHLMLIAKAN